MNQTKLKTLDNLPKSLNIQMLEMSDNQLNGSQLK